MAWVRSQYVANDRQIAEQVEQFRNHHQGKGSQMVDWTAAWRAWWGYGYHKHPRRAAGGAPIESSDPHANAEAIRRLKALV